MNERVISFLRHFQSGATRPSLEFISRILVLPRLTRSPKLMMPEWSNDGLSAYFYIAERKGPSGLDKKGQMMARQYTYPSGPEFDKNTS